jgi:hypothetical protein
MSLWWSLCVLPCSDVVTAPSSISAKAAQQLLRENKKGRLPLVNDKGQLVSTAAACSQHTVWYSKCSSLGSVSTTAAVGRRSWAAFLLSSSQHTHVEHQHTAVFWCVVCFATDC